MAEKIVRREIETRKGKYEVVAGALLSPDGRYHPACALSISGDNFVDESCGLFALSCIAGDGIGAGSTFGDHYVVMFKKPKRDSRINGERVVGRYLTFWYSRPDMGYLSSLEEGRYKRVSVSNHYTRNVIWRVDRGLLSKLSWPVFDSSKFDHLRFPFLMKMITRDRITPRELESFLEHAWGGAHPCLSSRDAMWALDMLRIRHFPWEQRNTKERIEKVLGKKVTQEQADYWIVNTAGLFDTGCLRYKEAEGRLEERGGEKK
ncbi:MAG: hypothetical protein ABIH92_02205 [Nanoarchaeota archaeon]